MPESSSLQRSKDRSQRKTGTDPPYERGKLGSRPNTRFGILDCYNRYEVIFSAFLLPEIGVYSARIENIFATDLVFLRITPIFAVYLVVQAILDLDEYGAERRNQMSMS
jgi:hypothetical protein